LIDLIVSVADHDPGTEIAVTQKDNRLRQIKSALDTLAKPTNGLVVLPRAGSARSKYEDFEIRDENGTRDTGEAIDYRAPSGKESVVGVPENFFLNGWIHALTDKPRSWLAVRTPTQLPQQSSRS
jgi:hypothetical protein